MNRKLVLLPFTLLILLTFWWLKQTQPPLETKTTTPALAFFSILPSKTSPSALDPSSKPTVTYTLTDCLNKLDPNKHTDPQQVLAQRQSMSTTWTLLTTNQQTLKLMKQINDNSETGTSQWTLLGLDPEGYPLPLNAKTYGLTLTQNSDENLKQFLALGRLEQTYETFTLDHDKLQGEGSLIDSKIYELVLANANYTIKCSQDQCRCQ